MAKLYDLEPRVEEILEWYPETRKDNFILYLKVLEDYIDTRMSIADVFTHRVELGIPSLESITRTRRKIQERRKDLIDEGAEKIRKQERAEFVQYALSPDDFE